jgi:hypothetical protein
MRDGIEFQERRYLARFQLSDHGDSSTPRRPFGVCPDTCR